MGLGSHLTSTREGSERPLYVGNRVNHKKMFLAKLIFGVSVFLVIKIQHFHKYPYFVNQIEVMVRGKHTQPTELHFAQRHMCPGPWTYLNCQAHSNWKYLG